jgi:hypothetical protein
MSKATNLGTEFFQITKEKRKGMEKLRWWCITKLTSNDTVSDKQRERWRDRIDIVSEILRGQFYESSQRGYLNNLRKLWIQETQLDKAVDILTKHNNKP